MVSDSQKLKFVTKFTCSCLPADNSSWSRAWYPGCALFPLTRYYGDQELSLVIRADFSLFALLCLAFVKMLAISITITGGWRGGIIIPLFFTGACIGKAVALTNPSLEPVLATICTMAALNVAVTRTPVSTTLLLAKLTGFSSFTPILFASLVGFFLAPKTPFIASQLKLNRAAPSN